MAERTADVIRDRDKEELRLLWMMFMLSSDIILVHELDGQIIDSNPTAQESLGYSAEELETMRIKDFALIAPSEWEHRRKFLEEGGVLKHRTVDRRKDGSTFEVEVTSRKVEVGGRSVVVGVGRDITGERLAEMMNQSLNSIGAALSSSLDHEGILKLVISTARKAMGADAAVIYTTGDGGWVPRYADGLPPEPEKKAYGKSEMRIFEMVERKGSAVVINDVLSDPRIDAKAVKRRSLRSMIVAPLRARGQLVGMMSFECHHRQGSFNDAHIDFANTLSNSISLFLENIQLSEEEREASGHLRDLMDIVPDGILILDKEGKFTYANAEAEHILRMRREDISTRGYEDPAWEWCMLEGQDRETPFALLKKHNSTYRDQEFMVRLPDGESVVLSISMSPTMSPRGEFDGAICSITDVTQRKRAESALMRRTHQLEVLSKVSVEINSELRTAMVMRKLVAAAMELTEATAGVYGRYEDGEIRYTEYAEGEDHLPLGLTFPPGQGVPGLVLETHRPYMTNDAVNDPHVIPEVRERLGVVNLVGVPIIDSGGELLGTLSVHNKAKGKKFEEEDVMILQGLAATAAVALDNARIMEQRDGFEKELQRQKRDYQTVFNSVPALIAIKDTDSRIVDANPAFIRAFGLDPDDREGWQTHATPEERGSFRRDDLEVIATKQAKYGIIEQGTDGRGNICWFRTDKLPYMDSAGDVVGVILFSLDITESKKAQEELVLEKDFMARLMETTPAGITVLYRNGQIVFANQVAERILGLSKGGLLTRTYNDPQWKITDYSGNPFPDEALPFRRVMDSGQPVFGVRHAIVHPDGRRVLLLINAAPLNEEGDLSGVIVSLMDVTEAVMAEEALQESLNTSDDIVRQMPSGILIFQYEGADRIYLVSANPTAQMLVGGLEGARDMEYCQIWEGNDFLATKDELLEVAKTGNTLWKENVHYMGGPAEGAFNLRAFSLPSHRICLNFDDVTQRLVEADLRRKAYSQIEKNIEHFATLVDRIRNPLSAIIAQAEDLGPDASRGILQRTEDIERIIKELDQGWIQSEKVRSFLKRNI